jgi:WhiB family redox-sensing transcriptional regulator
MAETAKAICAGCQVRADCLEAGLEEKYGVWGGTSARERARLRKLGRLEAA